MSRLLKKTNKFIKTDGRIVTNIPLYNVDYGSLIAIRYCGDKSYAAIVNSIKKKSVLICLQYDFPGGILSEPINILSEEDKNRLNISSTNSFISDLNKIKLLQVMWIPCSKMYNIDKNFMQIDKAAECAIELLKKKIDVYIMCNNQLNRTGSVVIKILMLLCNYTSEEAICKFMCYRKNFILESVFMPYIFGLNITDQHYEINTNTISPNNCPQIFDSDNNFIFSLPLSVKTNLEIIVSNYSVTPKYDGERCYIIADKSYLYLVFRNRRIIKITTVDAHFVLDAELIHNRNSDGSFSYIVFVFGCCMFNNVNYFNKGFISQQEQLNKIDFDKYSTAKIKIIKKKFDKLENYLQTVSSSRIYIRQIPILSNIILKENKIKKISIDGLILQAHTAGITPACIKLKPIYGVDIDCLVVKVSGNDTDLMVPFDYFLLLVLKSNKTKYHGSDWLPKNLRSEYIDIAMHTICKCSSDKIECSCCTLLYTALNKIVEVVMYNDYNVSVERLRLDKDIPNYDIILP